MIVGEGPGGRFVLATPTKCGTTTVEAVARRLARKGAGVEGQFRIYADESPRRQHRMAVPSGWEDADRYMLVRNPIKRWTSVYEYLRAPANYSQWGARLVQGRDWPGLADNPRADKKPMSFTRFLKFVGDSRELYWESREQTRRGDTSTGFAYRSPWIWLEPLDHQYEHLSFGHQGPPPKLIRLENLWEHLEALRIRYGLEDLDLTRKIHSNKSTGRKSSRMVDYYQKTCLVEERRGARGCGKCAVCRLRIQEECRALGYSTVI